MRIRVKICGLTSVDDALAAADLGADAVGLNFVPDSPRCIDLDRAHAISRALPPFVSRVAVVVDEDPDQVARLAAGAGIDWVQFHGDESPERCRRCPLPWLKAFRVREGFDLETLGWYGPGPHLLDAFDPERRGGTGRIFDWTIAARAARRYRIILSGGLDPDNILEAVAQARPHAVDVNSGVESSPGRKDREAMARLFSRLRGGGYL